jgi:hypothetical protein
MNMCQKKTFRILLLLSVFFCFGIHAYSNCNIQPFTTELSSAESNIENSFASDLDSFNADEINQSVEFYCARKALSRITYPANILFIRNYCISFWQPPKI